MVDIDIPVDYKTIKTKLESIVARKHYTKTQIDSQMNGKQDTLVSGTNIKTINGNGLLGSGNITIGGGGGLTIDDIYPIGSIYMTVDSTKDPNTLFTGTTWTKLEGRFLLGSGTTSGTSTSYTSGATSGEATHTLTVDEMPSHTHEQNPHHHSFNRYQNTGSTTSYGANWANQKLQSQNTSDTTATNKNTGGGQAHNNMPPYLVVNMWQRTA